MPLTDAVLHVGYPLLAAFRWRFFDGFLRSVSMFRGTPTRLPRGTSYCYGHSTVMDDKDPVTEALVDAEAKLQKLKSRDQLATDAREVFAELGSRVEAVLEERRSGQDRRTAQRSGVVNRRRGS